MKLVASSTPTDNEHDAMTTTGAILMFSFAKKM
jgi:hypothetical protein